MIATKTQAKTKLSNSMALLTSVTVAIGSIILYFIGASAGLLTVLAISSAVYWIPITLNKLGYNLTARLTQIMLSFVLIFILTVLFDTNTDFDFHYLVMIGLAILFFDDEIGKWKWVLAAMTLPLWILSLTAAHYFGPIVELESGVVSTMKLMNNILQFVFVGAILYFFSNETQVYVDKVEMQKQSLEKTNEELDRALEKANEATEYKSMFLANMSHEIRTPLNGVIMAGNLLLNSELDDSQKEAANIIRDSGGNLLVIVNDILDFSKVEANKLVFENDPFALRQTIESTLLPFKYECGKKKIDLALNYKSELPDVLVGDKQRVRQVLTNLVGNAVKFTDTGGVKVSVESLPSSHVNRTKICFVIEDSGIGIAPDKLESIFESFTQQDGGTNRKYGGTGLGTSIAKMLVDMMHGEIKAISPNPKNDYNNCPGTVMQFSIDLEMSDLPVDQVAQPTLRPAGEFDSGKQSEENQQAWSSTTKILLAEDNLINQKVAKMVFEKMGLSIEVVEDGEQAVHRAREEEFDLIFMDYMMPKVDGLQATAMLRESHVQTPIIAVTANAREQDRTKCLEAGMNDYISKPVSIEKLQLILNKWL